MSGAIIHGLSNEHYHARPDLGSSGLKKLARSPWHFYKTMADPERPPPEAPTPAMFAGTLAHCMILEPDKFEDRYTVRPHGIDGRTREGKAWILDHTHHGCEFISPEQYAIAMAQAEAVRTLPEVASLLDGDGWSEVSAFATDEQTGVALKARPDRVCVSTPDAVVLLDVKTCKSAEREEFKRAVVRFGYSTQAVHYIDVYERASQQMVLGMVFVCVESDYPHAAAAYMIEDEWLERAQRKRRRLIDLYAQCSASGIWPGYSATIEVLDMPRWLPEDDA